MWQCCESTSGLRQNLVQQSSSDFWKPKCHKSPCGDEDYEKDEEELDQI